MNKHVAVVEDELDIMELISVHLRRERFSVRGFLNGSSFLRSLDSEPPSLVVLDLMLPDVDGFEICRHPQGEACLCLDTHRHPHGPFRGDGKGARIGAWGGRLHDQALFAEGAHGAGQGRAEADGQAGG